MLPGRSQPSHGFASNGCLDVSVAFRCRGACRDLHWRMRDMRRSNWLIGVAALTLGALVASAAWAELPPKREFLPASNPNPMMNPSVPEIAVTTGDTAWVNAHTSGAACPGSPTRG